MYFTTLLTVINVISVNDKLEPQSNDWLQCIFGSFRMNKRPLCDKIRSSWLVKTNCQVPLCPKVFRILTKSFDSYTVKRKAITFMKLKELLLTHFCTVHCPRWPIFRSVCCLEIKKNTLKTVTSMENFHLALLFKRTFRSSKTFRCF
jgi:hypothetical protein